MSSLGVADGETDGEAEAAGEGVATGVGDAAAGVGVCVGDEVGAGVEAGVEVEAMIAVLVVGIAVATGAEGDVDARCVESTGCIADKLKGPRIVVEESVEVEVLMSTGAGIPSASVPSLPSTEDSSVNSLCFSLCL